MLLAGSRIVRMLSLATVALIIIKGSRDYFSFIITTESRALTDISSIRFLRDVSMNEFLQTHFRG